MGLETLGNPYMYNDAKTRLDKAKSDPKAGKSAPQLRGIMDVQGRLVEVLINLREAPIKRRRRR